MKNYLLILLLIGQFSNAQYNLFARQNFAKSASAPTYNTYIGGVSATISSASALSTKLGISVGAISNFTIVGSDIKCKITGSYSNLNGFAFNQTPCTYYRDTDYLVTSVFGNCFYFTNIAGSVDFQNATSVSNGFEATPLLTEILLKNATSVGNSGFAQSTNGTRTLKTCYIPNVTSLGTTAGDNSVFTGNCAGLKVYANPSLATNNAGAPDGDLAYVTANSGSVVYVTNFTSPNPITDLSAGTIYNTAIQLNFTPPSSTNAIEFYECYANGVFKNKITGSGQYITGLTASTNYNITVVAVDIFYNKSVVSNVVNATTTSTNATASETNSYETRVLADSGVLIDKTNVNEDYVKVISAGISGNLLSWHNYRSGLKKDGSNLVEKMYSFVDSNFDVVQTTAANKPLYTSTGITFDLTDNLSKTLSPVVTNKTFTIMWKLKATPGNYYPGINLGSWDSFTAHSASGGLIYAGITIANRFALGGGSFLTSTDATYTFTYNSTTKIGKIYRDTTLLSSKTMVDPIDWTAFAFDAQNGTFYDAKIFSKDLSLTEITNIL